MSDRPLAADRPPIAGPSRQRSGEVVSRAIVGVVIEQCAVEVGKHDQSCGPGHGVCRRVCGGPAGGSTRPMRVPDITLYGLFSPCASPAAIESTCQMIREPDHAIARHCQSNFRNAVDRIFQT